MSASKGYTRTAIALHWLIFLLVAGALVVGWTMGDMGFSPTKLRLVNYHKWVGVTILLLVVIRILWKLTHKAPPMVPMSRLQTILAHATHGILYLLLIAVPVSGYVHSNASGFPIVWFGKIPLPDMVGKDEALAHSSEEVHGALAMTLAILVGLHLLAALKHHYMDKDETLARMLPFLKR